MPVGPCEEEKWGNEKESNRRMKKTTSRNWRRVVTREKKGIG